MWWGPVCALAAALAYGLASVMQSMAAKATPGGGDAVDPRLLIRVIGQWRFLAGIGLDLLGFGFQLAALQVLPLFVVQAALAASLAVTAVAARFLGVRLGRREWAAVAAVCVGLGLLGMSAESEGSSSIGNGFRWGLVAAVVLLGAIGLSAGLAPQRLRAPLLGLIAGLSFGVVAISGRVIPSLRPADLLTEAATYTAIVAGALAMLFFASALQRGSITTATAMLVVGETVFPAAVGILALGDRTRPGFIVPAAAGFALAIAAALMLARFGEPTPQSTSSAGESPPSRESSASPAP
jgi:drug/metabolite transporter (DMT)-like permease